MAHTRRTGGARENRRGVAQGGGGGAQGGSPRSRVTRVATGEYANAVCTLPHFAHPRSRAQEGDRPCDDEPRREPKDKVERRVVTRSVKKLSQRLVGISRW
jgi:hypothetical protein